MTREQDTDDPTDFDVVVEDRPPGTPADFSARIAAACESDDPTRIAEAEDDYRGIYDSWLEYIIITLDCELPEYLHWLSRAVPPDELRRGYERGTTTVWEIALEDGRVMVFESRRQHPVPITVL